MPSKLTKRPEHEYFYIRKEMLYEVFTLYGRKKTEKIIYLPGFLDTDRCKVPIINYINKYIAKNGDKTEEYKKRKTSI